MKKLSLLFLLAFTFRGFSAVSVPETGTDIAAAGGALLSSNQTFTGANSFTNTGNKFLGSGNLNLLSSRTYPTNTILSCTNHVYLTANTNVITSPDNAFSNLVFPDGNIRNSLKGDDFILASENIQYRILSVDSSSQVHVRPTPPTTRTNTAYSYYPVAIASYDVQPVNFGYLSANDGGIGISGGNNSGSFETFNQNADVDDAWVMNSSGVYNLIQYLGNISQSPNVIEIDKQNGNNYESIHIWPDGKVSNKYGYTNFGPTILQGSLTVAGAANMSSVSVSNNTTISGTNFTKEAYITNGITVTGSSLFKVLNVDVLNFSDTAPQFTDNNTGNGMWIHTGDHSLVLRAQYGNNPSITNQCETNVIALRPESGTGGNLLVQGNGEFINKVTVSNIVLSSSAAPIFNGSGITNPAPTTVTQSGTNLVLDGSTAGYSSSMRFRMTLTNNVYIQLTNWSVGALVTLYILEGSSLNNLVTYNTNESATIPYSMAANFYAMPTNRAKSSLLDQWYFASTTNAVLGGQTPVP